MTTHTPPLTEAELDELERLDERAPVPLATSRRVYAMARRCITLESELAQLRREKAEREGRLRELAARYERRIGLLYEAWKQERDLYLASSFEGRYAELRDTQRELNAELKRAETP